MARPMKPRIDLEQLARRESEQTEWKENVADISDVVETLSAFANDLQNLGGGYVVCGAREVADEHGFPRLIRAGLTASRLEEIENTVLVRCRERVSPPITPLVEELVGDDAHRRICGTDYAERVELTGSLVEQAVQLSKLVLSEASLTMDKTNLSRPNVVRYPDRALMEAFGNALAHRDYSLDAPTRITAFADRIEFHSPGGLPVGVSLAKLRKGQAGPRWRNQTLAWAFMKLGIAQGEGQGVTTIRAQMKAAGNPAPEFMADEVSVTCVLRAHRSAAKARGGS